MSAEHLTAPVEHRPIPNFPGYRVGNDGSIWTCRKRGGASSWTMTADWFPMKPRPDKHGYLRVDLWRDGKRYARKVHTLVLEAFVGPRPEGMVACHDPDHNRDNCRLDNLRWATQESNCADTAKHGRVPLGLKRKGAKLSDDNVRAVFEMRRAGKRQPAIAAALGICQQTVSDILTGRRRASVKRNG